MLTAGFFMLPFAVGAAVAAVLAFFDVVAPGSVPGVPRHLGLALVALRRFAASDHEPSYPVGAKRYVGARRLVLEDIDPVRGVGRVKLDAEEWNATTNGEEIAAGVKVTVVQVRGTRLVVEVAGRDQTRSTSSHVSQRDPSTGSPMPLRSDTKRQKGDRSTT